MKKAIYGEFCRNGKQGPKINYESSGGEEASLSRALHCTR
jgi:hypothetical protein